MRINQDNRIDDVLRGSSIGSFNLSPVSISTTVIANLPITVGASYEQTKIQSILDCIKEISKPLA